MCRRLLRFASEDI
ncbi:hypothetical protein J5751_04470 [bacterium]|nr:hypothetical protein [bacterium]MBQ2599896.1 hypothetical protein [bacterium]